jgi:hypothetical protein
MVYALIVPVIQPAVACCITHHQHLVGMNSLRAHARSGLGLLTSSHCPCRPAGSRAGTVDNYYVGPVGKRLRASGEMNQRFQQHADVLQSGPAADQVHEYLHRCAVAPEQVSQEVQESREVEGAAGPEALLLLYSRSIAGGRRSKHDLLNDAELGRGKEQQAQLKQQRQQEAADSQQQVEDAG